MPSFSNLALCLLQLYFLLMNFTVERSYCMGDFTDNPDGFLVPETVAFCKENNPLFLERPEWMVKATCAHSHIFPVGYALILIVTITNTWRTFAVPLLLFIGAKMNAIFFYHYMEFTSHVPPRNLVAYFSVEGPYILSMLMVILKILLADESNDKISKKKVN